VWSLKRESTEKNRYVGVLKIQFADGYVETCVIREKKTKGKRNFMEKVHECAVHILGEAAQDVDAQGVTDETTFKTALETLERQKLFAKKSKMKFPLGYHGDFYIELLEMLLPPEYREKAEAEAEFGPL